MWLLTRDREEPLRFLQLYADAGVPEAPAEFGLHLGLSVI
jgi:hypothetical protein